MGKYKKEWNDGARKEKELLKKVGELLAKQDGESDLSDRGEKQRLILSLLARGVALGVSLFAPGITRVLRPLQLGFSDEEEWKVFNRKYLQQAICRLEKQKIVEVRDRGKFGIVKLTDKGRHKVLKFAVESLTINKPDWWDGKWRLVVYDVDEDNKVTRDRFRSYLLLAGFYPLQESVYLHAYPCEEEVEFLRYYLGIGSEVRLMVVDRIENDEIFRKYFNV